MHHAKSQPPERHFSSGRFNSGLWGFQGFTQKNGCIQRSKDGVKGPFYEMVPMSTSSSESHEQPLFPTHVPLHVHTHLTCTLALTGANKIRNQSPHQPGPPPSPFLGTVFCQDRKLPHLIFQAAPLARQSEIKVVIHILVSFHTL